VSSGMNEFLLATQFDETVELICARYGNSGLASLVRIWQKIYRVEGYWMPWDEDSADLFNSQSAHWEKQKLVKMVSECLDRGLFSKEKYQQYQVLTSAAIQKRYFRYKARAKACEVEENLLCIQKDDIACRNLIFVCKKFKTACNSSPIRFDLTRSDTEDDAAHEPKTVNWQKLYHKLEIPIRRERDIYLGSDNDRINWIVVELHEVMNSITDYEIVQKINVCSKAQAARLWEKVSEIYDPYRSKEPIANKSGYLRTTVENMFK